MNQRIATLKWRGAALVICGGLVTCMVPACGGDDTTPPPGEDSGPDVVTPTDSGGTQDAKADVTTTTEAGLDAAPDNTTVEAGPDVAADVTTNDVRSDVTADVSTNDVRSDASDAGDATTADASDAQAEAEASTQAAPLMLCSVFDTDDFAAFDPNVGGTPLGDPTQDATTRSLAWGTDIAVAFTTALTNDCRTSGIASIAMMAPGGVANGYLPQIARYSVALMGCGEDPEAGAVTYTNLLLPDAAHVYSVADANIITDLYINAVLAAAAKDWADTFAIETMFPSAQPLTTEQTDQITAAVQALQAADGTLNPSQRQSSINTCGDDAGAEGGSDAGEDAADAGADASND